MFSVVWCGVVWCGVVWCCTLWQGGDVSAGDSLLSFTVSSSAGLSDEDIQARLVDPVVGSSASGTPSSLLAFEIVGSAEVQRAGGERMRWHGGSLLWWWVSISTDSWCL